MGPDRQCTVDANKGAAIGCWQSASEGIEKVDSAGLHILDKKPNLLLLLVCDAL
jgi:hypothetical protein